MLIKAYIYAISIFYFLPLIGQSQVLLRDIDSLLIIHKVRFNGSDSSDYCLKIHNFAQKHYDVIELKESIALNEELYNNFHNFLLNSQPKTLYKTCLMLGADYNYLGKNKEALCYLAEGQRINKEKQLQDKAIYKNLFQIFLDIGNYSEAHYNATEFQKQSYIDNDSLGIALGFVMYGRIEQKLEKYLESNNYYIKAALIYDKDKTSQEFLNNQISIGNNYLNLGLYDKAIPYYYYSLKHNILENNKGVCYINLMLCHLRLNQLDSFEVYRAEFEKNKSQYSALNYDYLDIIGNYHFRTQNFDKAATFLEITTAYYKKSESLKDLLINQKLLSQSYFYLKNYKKAYEYLAEYTENDKKINAQKFSVLDSIFLKNAQLQKSALQKEAQLKTLEAKNLLRAITIVLLVITILGMSIIYLLFKRSEKIKIRTALDKEETAKKIKSIEEFNYTLSHDLNTPLNNAQKILDFLPTNTISNQDLTLLQENIVNAKEIITTLLNFTKLEKQGMYLTHFDIIILLEKIIKEYTAPNVNITINYPNTNNTQIDADRVLLKIAIGNIIENAKKYGLDYSKKLTLDITISNIDKDIVITFTDSGSGIPEKYHESIFDIFEQIGNENYQMGFGIGLATVKKIVEKHNGTIQAKNHPKGGAVFELKLPTQPFHS